MNILNFNTLISYHEHWRKFLPKDDANKYIALSRMLLHKAIDCDGNLSGITISYPEDCSDYHIFYDFLDIVGHNSLKANGTSIVATFY